MAMVDNYVCVSDGNINIFVEITQVFRMRISFVREGINTNHREKKNARENIYLALNIVLGLGLSSICYFLYNSINLKWLNILMAVVSIVFMFMSCFFLLEMDGSRKKTLKISMIFSLVYWVAVFVFLLIINQNSIPDIGQRAIHLIYYAIYAMPSYIVVVIVAFLIMAAASYA